MDARTGSYALIFSCLNRQEVEVGALGRLQLLPGYYVYVGSAFGPGGIAARIAHHRKISQRPHWHLDYLRPHLRLLEIWYTHDSEQREHEWVLQLSKLRGAVQPFNGFGASDCSCPTHLFRYGFKPSFTGFRRRMRQRVPRHGRFYRERVSEG